MALSMLKRRHYGTLTLDAEDDCRALAEVLRSRGLPAPDAAGELRGVPFTVTVSRVPDGSLTIALPAFGPCATWPIAAHYVYDYLQGRGGRLTLEQPLPIKEVPVCKGLVRYVIG